MKVRLKLSKKEWTRIGKQADYKVLSQKEWLRIGKEAGWLLNVEAQYDWGDVSQAKIDQLYRDAVQYARNLRVDLALQTIQRAKSLEQMLRRKLEEADRKLREQKGVSEQAQAQAQAKAKTHKRH